MVFIVFDFSLLVVTRLKVIVKTFLYFRLPLVTYTCSNSPTMVWHQNTYSCATANNNLSVWLYNIVPKNVFDLAHYNFIRYFIDAVC